MSQFLRKITRQEGLELLKEVRKVTGYTNKNIATLMGYVDERRVAELLRRGAETDTFSPTLYRSLQVILNLHQNFIENSRPTTYNVWFEGRLFDTLQAKSYQDAEEQVKVKYCVSGVGLHYFDIVALLR